MLAEGIIKFELCVFNGFGHTVHLESAVMDEDLWICHRDYVNFSIGKFLVEDGPLLEANTDFHLVRKCMLAPSW